MATKTVQRRKLHFDSIEELLRELSRIETAYRAGHLRTTGNWTAGQILSHIADWIEYGYDGYPMKPPMFLVKWILRLMLPKMLRDGMRPGVHIPGVKGGTTGADLADTQIALDRVRAAFERLSSGEAAKFASPAFGEMSHEDRIKLNLRHAELHLGFLATD